MKKSPLKYFILGDIIGPVLFTTVTLICAGLRPDYNHISQFISERNPKILGLGLYPIQL